MFGCIKPDRVFNLILLKAKYFIYTKYTIPIFDIFKTVLKSYYQLEKYNAVKNGNMVKFDKEWNTYKTLFLV